MRSECILTSCSNLFSLSKPQVVVRVNRKYYHIANKESIQILTKNLESFLGFFFLSHVVHEMFRDILRQMFMIRFCIAQRRFTVILMRHFRVPPHVKERHRLAGGECQVFNADPQTQITSYNEFTKQILKNYMIFIPGVISYTLLEVS